MSVFDRDIDLWTFPDLEQLVKDHVEESQTLEYKRDAYGTDDENRRELLRDVVSIANAYGGTLLIGIDEDEHGAATALPGIDGADVHLERTLGISLASIEPRITGLRMRAIPAPGGKAILCLSIPRSHRAPHMVMYKGLNQFWVRHDRQKGKMSVEEIGDAFLKTRTILEDLKSFLKHRRESVQADFEAEPLILIGAGPMIVQEEFVDIMDARVRKVLEQAPSIRSGGWSEYLYESTGRLIPTLQGVKSGAKDNAELEIFRNGYLEARILIDDKFRDRVIQKTESPPTIYCYPLIEYIVTFCHSLKAFREAIGLQDPYVLSVALLNIKDFGLRKFGPRAFRYSEYLERWPRQDLIVPSVQVADFSDADKVAEHIANRIWQAFGFENAPLFDAGKYNPPKD